MQGDLHPRHHRLSELKRPRSKQSPHPPSQHTSLQWDHPAPYRRVDHSWEAAIIDETTESLKADHWDDRDSSDLEQSRPNSCKRLNRSVDHKLRRIQARLHHWLSCWRTQWNRHAIHASTDKLIAETEDRLLTSRTIVPRTRVWQKATSTSPVQLAY